MTGCTQCGSVLHSTNQHEGALDAFRAALPSGKQYYRQHRNPYSFTVVMLTEGSDVEFANFDTYDEALARVKEYEFKAWIFGPEWIEDHS